MATTGRHDVDFEGVDPVVLSFKHDVSIVFDSTKDGGSLQVGLALTLSASRTVGLVADGEDVLGKLLKVEGDGFCTVQVGGGVSLPAGTGAAITPGKKIVGDLLVAAKGYVREVAAATLAEVAVARHRIVENSDSTNVQILLDA